MSSRLLFCLAFSLTLFGCGQDNDEPATAAPETTPPPAAPSAPPAFVRKSVNDGARVYIVSPAYGAEVQSPVTVVFGLVGAGVAPAGIDLPNTGHHHLMVDTELANMDFPIPADAQHIHFGLGQTEASIELAPGEHTLQLVLGDTLHIPHDPPLASPSVMIQVVD
jgi:hypothetical protein